MTPKISVIVPVYNVEKYLPRCIDSILSQSFTDFELLLIDDGSPDNCGKICDEYAKRDSRVKVFHKPNGGVSAARNLGIKNAMGEWITFIDADDYIEDDFLSLPNEVPEDLLIQNYKVLLDSKFVVHDFEHRLINFSEIHNFLNNNIGKEIFSSPWAKFYRRELIKDGNISFPEEIKVGEDALFVLDYLCYTKSILFLSKANYIYVGGFSSDKYKLTAEKSVNNFKEVILRYNKLNLTSEKYLRQVFLFYYGLLSPKDSCSLMAWQRDKIVRSVYADVYKGFGVKWNFIYLIYPIYSKVVEIVKKLI